jgi:uracil-DNA glycosylase
MMTGRVTFGGFDDYREQVFTCRECRRSGFPEEEAFEQATEGRPPQIADGPERIDILQISLNPKLHRGQPIPRTMAEYSSQKPTHAKPKDGRWDGRRYVFAVERALPAPYSWWSTTHTVGNTRVCKCPTEGWSGQLSWAAARCANRFLQSEIELLRPKVLLVLGKTEWPRILPYLRVAVPDGDGPHLAEAEVGNLRLPAVVAKHLTRASRDYRSAVKDALGIALNH